MIAARRHARTLPAVAILALGANGPIAPGQIASALRIMGPHRVLGLVTARKSSVSTARMRRAARRHPDRVLLIDWVAFSAGHGSWFGGDGLHVNFAGASAFARLVRRSVAPFAFPPVRALHLPRRAGNAKRCGVIHRFGHPLRVYVVRGRQRVMCRRARALMRRPPLRAIRNWQRYDWRRTQQRALGLGVRAARPQGDRRSDRRTLTLLAVAAGRAYAAQDRAASAYSCARAR